MAQRVNVLDVKTDNLNSMPGSHMVEREHELLQVVLRLPHMHQDMHVLNIETHTHTLTLTHTNTYTH